MDVTDGTNQRGRRQRPDTGTVCNRTLTGSAEARFLQLAVDIGDPPLQCSDRGIIALCTLLVTCISQYL